MSKALKNIVFPSTMMILLHCTGCLPDRAVVSPWGERYTPQNAYTSWTPTASAKQKKLPLPLTLPEQIDPLSLGEILDIALKNNTQTQVTWAQAREAAAQFAQSQSGLFPTVTGSFAYTRTFQPTISQNNPILPGEQSVLSFFLSAWGPQLSLSYTIFDFGQIRATSEAARQALFFADWTHNREIQTVIQTVTLDYYNYQYQAQLLKANQADVETAKTTLDYAKIGRTAGVKNTSDYLQARTQLLKSEIQLVNQRQAVQNAFATLLNDMGIPSSQTFPIQEMPAVNPHDHLLDNSDTLISIALDHRADLLAAEADLHSKQAQVRAARLQFLPKIDGSFSIGRTYFTGGLHDDYDFIGVLALNVPIFSGFSTLNSVRVAKAQREQSRATLRQVQLDVIKDITTSYFNVKIAFDALKYADAYLKSSEEEYKVALREYKVGTKTILDVVSAQSSLADARAQQANATQQWYSSLATLAYSTGIISEVFTKEML